MLAKPELMEPLCSMHGIGKILADGLEFADVTYLVECWRQPDGSIIADGIIDAETPNYKQICKAVDVVLVLSDGDRIPVSVGEMEAGHLKIQVLDPMFSCMPSYQPAQARQDRLH